MLKNTQDRIVLFTSLLICFLPAIIGGLVTSSSVNTWYQTLQRPSFAPPNWLFGPVWTLLYFMQGISLYLIRQSQAESVAKLIAGSFFYIQLGFNLFWSILFFGFKNPFAGLLEIGFLVISVVFTIISSIRVSKTAALLLLPYLAWISFASYLNFAVYQLNR